MRRERSCGIVTFRQSDGQRQYLLLQYPGGHWDFPKGHMEKGEAEEDTARRELREETGIEDVRMDLGFRRLIRYKFNGAHGQSIDKTVVFFCGRVEADKLEISHEHRGYQWLAFDAALDKVTFDNARQLLRKCEEHVSARAAA